MPRYTVTGYRFKSRSYFNVTVCAPTYDEALAAFERQYGFMDGSGDYAEAVQVRDKDRPTLAARLRVLLGLV